MKTNNSAMPKILFMAGSLRAASASKAMAMSMAARLENNAEVSFAQIGSLLHYNADTRDDPEVAALVDAIKAADGVVFVDKPCFVISVSGGALGGVRAQSHLKYILNGMLAMVFPALEVVAPFAKDKNRDGRIVDKPVLSFVAARLAEFLSFLGERRA
ncbi:MAG: NAD(P)H-dependent oxidoreductase [Candidatus Devosia euplotis]|nr:NAD(P)H-dependent oxidoreductase [Candidatus Devosia euplotis]